LDLLYTNYRANEQAIITLERELDAICDMEIRRQLNEKKIFENLNFEKPSKTFLDIARNINKGDGIEVICNNDGTPFDNDQDRNEYITNYYADLYREDYEVGGSIEDFLGPTICESQLVRESKVTNIEKDTLDQDLTLAELKKALDESNFKSAPGIDGFSNKFIKKFWGILGGPLLNVCKQSLEDGSLIDTFATAQIRIIPKKGDCSN
jgi:hypothetical protein